MEKMNLLYHEGLYDTGLLAEQFSQCLYASNTVNEINIENMKTLSDEHTYYYCILLRKIKGDDYIINVFFDTDTEHELLIAQLSEMNVNCMFSTGKRLNRILLDKKSAKKALPSYKKLRHQAVIPSKTKGRFQKIKQFINRKRDDEYET